MTRSQVLFCWIQTDREQILLEEGVEWGHLYRWSDLSNRVINHLYLLASPHLPLSGYTNTLSLPDPYLNISGLVGIVEIWFSDTEPLWVSTHPLRVNTPEGTCWMLNQLAPPSSFYCPCLHSWRAASKKIRQDYWIEGEIEPIPISPGAYRPFPYEVTQRVRSFLSGPQTLLIQDLSRSFLGRDLERSVLALLQWGLLVSDLPKLATLDYSPRDRSLLERALSELQHGHIPIGHLHGEILSTPPD